MAQNTGLSFRKLLQLLNCIEHGDKAESFDSLLADVKPSLESAEPK